MMDQISPKNRVKIVETMDSIRSSH